jgi:uncharacterized protein YbjQ (UPF0145 family)
MTKTVFKVRVVTKDVLTDAFARFKSIIGGRIKAYEHVNSKCSRGCLS